MALVPSFTRYPDLATRDLAGSVVSANDELFAPRQNLIMPLPAVHAADEFGHTGKVYDGWETRRRRVSGHDWAVVRLGCRASCTASWSTPPSSRATSPRTCRWR